MDPVGANDESSLDDHHFHRDLSKANHYALSAKYQGTVRLNLQQYIWQQSMGFNIHPSIPTGSSSSIADVACGTALWLMEVSRQLGSSCDLHGFDISLKQASPKPWLPANVSLHTWSVYDDVPDQFVGKFDLVHVRLITLVVKNNDPEPIMRNLCRLPKPGGYLQWDKVDVSESFIAKAYPDMDAPAMDAWCGWMRSQENTTTTVMDWKPRMPALLEKNGFAAVMRYEMKDQLLKHMGLMRYNNDQLLVLCEQSARRAYAEGNGATVKLLRILNLAAKEAEKGAILIQPIFCWVAKRQD